MRCGHLVASAEISLIQNGHFFVVGAGGASFFFRGNSLLKKNGNYDSMVILKKKFSLAARKGKVRLSTKKREDFK